MQIYFNHVAWNIHPVYQEMLNYPPEWVIFLNAWDFGKSYQNTAKNNIKKTSLITLKDDFLGYIKSIYFLPNITFRKLRGDMVYSCQTIPLFGEYILDIDCYEAINRFSNKISNLSINILIVKMFLRQKRCKKIVFWSEAAKKSFQSYLWWEFNEKLEILYPSIAVQHDLDTLLLLKSRTVINIVTIAKDFIYKSWEEILEVAMKLLEIHDNLNFTIIWNVGSSLREKYKHSNIHFVWLLERDQVLAILVESHIFLLPTFIDIFWYAFLEAYSHGLISIWWDGFATKEIINNTVDGFIVDGYSQNVFDRVTYRKNWTDLDDLISMRDNHEKKKIIQDIFQITNSCIVNYSEYSNLFLPAWFEKVKNGKFSLSKRNGTLIKILSQ